MTKIHSLTIKPKSPWTTPLQADTIFGHLCWKIKNDKGEEELEKFLEKMKEKPIFTISNAFPCGYISRPRFEVEFKKEEKKGKTEMNSEFERIKKYTRDIKFIKIKDLEKYFFRFSEIEDEKNKDEEMSGTIEEIVENFEDKEYFQKDREIKNTINRFTSTTLEKQGPYSLPYFFSEEDLWILIKVLDEKKFEEYNIKENLKRVFSEGYGKRKSIGRGVFEIVRYCEEEKISQNPNGKHYLLLSNFVPKKEDPAKGLYEIFMKYGKLGEEKSIAGAGNFYKKPLIMIKEGATFEIGACEDKEYFGKMFGRDNSISTDKEIYHYAYGFSLKF